MSTNDLAQSLKHLLFLQVPFGRFFARLHFLESRRTVGRKFALLAPFVRESVVRQHGQCLLEPVKSAYSFSASQLCQKLDECNLDGIPDVRHMKPAPTK
jgi:hypothetical protein